MHKTSTSNGFPLSVRYNLLNSLLFVSLITPLKRKSIKPFLQEADALRKSIKGLAIPLCIEGKQLSSVAFSQMLTQQIPMKDSAVTFIIGSSFGLDDSVKQQAYCKLSMSAMTFPHALASVMLLEQIYRAYQIDKGTGYHK